MLRIGPAQQARLNSSNALNTSLSTPSWSWTLVRVVFSCTLYARCAAGGGRRVLSNGPGTLTMLHAIHLTGGGRRGGVGSACDVDACIVPIAARELGCTCSPIRRILSETAVAMASVVPATCFTTVILHRMPTMRPLQLVAGEHLHGVLWLLAHQKSWSATRRHCNMV